MKKAEDFRKAFGPATPGFESVVKKTMKELRAQEVKPAVKEWLRWRRPVFAMAMALVLFVGFVAVNGTLNPFSQTDRIRSEEENLYTAQPITTVLSMGAGQEEGNGDGVESGLSEEESIRIRLEEEAPGMSAKLFPVNKVYEANGLRVEVVSGYVSGSECCFVISVQDTEGKYTEYISYPWFGCDIAGFSGYSTSTLYINKAEHKTVYMYMPKLNNPVPTDDRTIKAGVEIYHIDRSSYVDLLPLLEQYGKNVQAAEQPKRLQLAGAANTFPAKDMKFLDYTQPLDIPLLGDVCLSGIGWIDGQLHVQYHYKGEPTYKAGSVTSSDTWTVFVYSSADDLNYSPVQWDANLDGYAEWEEFIYDVKPEEIDDLVLNAGIRVLNEVLDDGWMVEFPLKTVCPDVLEMDPEIEERLNGFMTAWSTLDYNGMLTLCNPAWQANTEDPRQVLMDLTKNATLLENRYEKITGTAEDTVRTVTCGANIQRPGNMPHTFFELNVEVEKAADGLWYINPESLKNWIVTEDIRVEPVESGVAEEPVRLDRLEDYKQMELWQFFESWVQNDEYYMLYTLTPECRNGGQETLVQLRELMESGTPLSYQINGRREESWGSVYVCTVEMDPGNGEEPRYERFDFRMMKNKQGWDYGIDLTSLKERQPGEKNPDLETVSLTREAIINDYLDYFYPGLRERLQPIGLSCEKNGIRMELISGLIDRTEEWIIYSLEDAEGKFDDYNLSTDTLEDDAGIWKMFSSSPIYRDKAEHKAYFVWNPHYGRLVDTTARDVTLTLNSVKGQLNKVINVSELLKQHGKDEEGVRVTEDAWGIDSDTPETRKVLDYHKPLDVQLLPNTTLTGIGWIDNQLHVQFCIKGQPNEYSINFSETVEGKGETGKNRQLSYSPVDWFGDVDTYYLEYVFNYKPWEEKEITLAADLNIAQESVTGPWEFRFPLGMICPDVKDEKNPEAEDEAAPVERLEEDFGNISLEEREGKITFDVYANTDVYTKNGIGYVLGEDGTAEAVATSIRAAYDDAGITIPEEVNGHVVTTIGTGAFMDSSVKSVILPDTVKSIKSCAFEDCDKLQFLRIPDGVTAIEASVFLNCISLTEVAIPDSVTVIGDQAFNSCRSLTKVRIPEGTVEIGSYAFVGCESLTSVTLPEGLQTLGENAFYRCAGLETIEVPDGMSFLGQGAFKDCTSLKSARLPEGTTYINPDVFAGCAALETVNLPESLGTIGDRVFKECGSLKEIILPEGLEHVGRAAFMNCTGLEEVVIPESVYDMEENVFKGCTGLTCTVKDGSYAMKYCEENGIPYVVK